LPSISCGGGSCNGCTQMCCEGACVSNEECCGCSSEHVDYFIPSITGNVKSHTPGTASAYPKYTIYAGNNYIVNSLYIHATTKLMSVMATSPSTPKGTAANCSSRVWLSSPGIVHDTQQPYFTWRPV
jgi:hypothetical protein